MIQLGWRLVQRDAWRSLLAMAGIGVAVLIAFVEMGFMNGVLDSQLRIVEAARGDLVVLDKRRVHLDKWDSLLPIRLAQIAGLPGVAAVLPLHQVGVNLRSGIDQPEKRLILLAFSPDAPPLELGLDQATLDLLREPNTVLFDRKSRPIYGELQVGQDVWVEGRRLRMGGFVSLGPTLIIDGALVTSESTLRTFNPLDRPIMAVIQVDGKSAIEQVKQSIRAQLWDDVDVYRPEELADREISYLRRVAPIGLLFGAGMAAGLFVGLVICYQVLYVAIRRRIQAFATLKAMGFSNGFVIGAILHQAVLYAAGGFLIGLAGAWFLYQELALRTGLAILLNAPRIGAIALACLLASVVAGLVAARQVINCEPADLY
jgi:putative ABC transport system permease protein